MNPEATFFRSRPILVEARRLVHPGDYEAIAQWCDGELVDLTEYIRYEDDGVMWVRDGEGNWFMGERGDWIVRGPGAGFTVMRPEAFDGMYEAAVQL